MLTEFLTLNIGESPQRRRRIYLVADFRGECAGKVLFEREGLRGYFTESGTPWQTASADAQRCVDSNDREGAYTVDQGGGKSSANFYNELSPTLTCTHGGEPAVAYTLDPGIAQREGGHIYEGVSGTLRANAGDNQMAVAYNVTCDLVLDDQGGQQISVRTDGKSPTLRAETHGNLPCVMDAVGLDVYNQSVTGDVSKSLTAIKSDADHTPVAVIPYTLKIRSGCEGGGKGALIQEDKSATLSTLNDQYLFQPVCYGISSFESNAMKSSNPHSGIYEADTRRTLDLNGGNPACNQGGVMVVEPIAVATQQGGAEISENGICPTVTAAAGMSGNNQPWIAYTEDEQPVCYDARGNGDGVTSSTITGDHENRITDYTSVVVEQKCFAMQAFGKYSESETGSAMKARDFKDATDLVVEPIALDRAFYNQGENALYDPQYYTDGTVPTLVARGPGAVQVRYIVRRLTPTECARLQGFADRWGDIDHKADFSDEEYKFWLDVRNTHAEINGKQVKEYAKKQMLTWYNKLHTDSAEYKMWGNGIALPCSLYVMQGISAVMANES